MYAGAAEEPELILAEAVEVRARHVVDLGADLLEAGEVPVLAGPDAPAGELLLGVLELRRAGEAPGIPLRSPAHAAVDAEAVARARERAGQLHRMGQVVARQHEALAGVVRLPEVEEEDVVLQAELDEVAERPAE